MKNFHLTHTGYMAGAILCGASREDSTWDKLHAIYAPLHLKEIRANCCIDCLAEFVASYEDEPAEDLPPWLDPEAVSRAVKFRAKEFASAADRYAESCAVYRAIGKAVAEKEGNAEAELHEQCCREAFGDHGQG